MTEPFKAYISALMRKCRDQTFHGEYDLRFVWSATPHDGDDNHSRSYATVKIDATYLWATVTVYPPMFEQYEAGDFKGCAKDILHEACHLFTEPIARIFMWDTCSSQRDGYRDIIERQTERICHALFGVMPDGWYTPKALGLKKPKPVKAAA